MTLIDAQHRFAAVNRVGGSGSGGGGDNMEHLEKRVEKLEDCIPIIKEDVAVIKSNYAKSNDISDAKVSLIKWMVATMLSAAAIAVGLGVGIARLIPNQQQQPIIINVPEQPPAAAAKKKP